MPTSRKYSPEVVRDRIRQWCDRGERAHTDVITKLRNWGVPTSERAELLAELISDNLINEERYAGAFASDHFRLRGWGPVKIAHALKQKGVSERNIERALRMLPQEDTPALMKKAVERILPRLHGLQAWQKQQKAGRYLLSRGFSSDGVWPFVNQIFGDKKT